MSVLATDSDIELRTSPNMTTFCHWI